MLRFFTSKPQTQRDDAFPQFVMRRTPLVQRFVETGDERCPLAGMWTLAVHDDAADDCERRRLATGFSLPWRAFIAA